MTFSCRFFKKTFINAQILEEVGEEWKFNEGCLSIPKIREDVLRKPKLTIEYYDEKFKKHTETYDGVIARVIQHEYDHIEGVLFTDKINNTRIYYFTKSNFRFFIRIFNFLDFFYLIIY